MSENEIHPEHAERNDISFLYNRISDVKPITEPSLHSKLIDISDVEQLTFRYFEPLSLKFSSSQEVGVYVKELIQLELTMDEIWTSTSVLVEARNRARVKLEFCEKCRILHTRMQWILKKTMPDLPSEDEYELANWIGSLNYLLSIMDAARNDFNSVNAD